ncbi:MAG: hypothetical protein LUH15_06470 [Tannerellaceae bacterium]|nr:hypothetical protein [Tannerellaceae bacterium]
MTGCGEVFLSIIFLFILIFPGLYLIIAGIIKPKRVITFDRINGTVTFYGIRWGKEITQKFKEACFSSTIRHMKYLPIGFELSLRRNKIGFISINVDPFYEKDISPEEIFSYLVWYMDKNRPLPPGSALDPYRKKNYKRRKKKDFHHHYITHLSIR